MEWKPDSWRNHSVKRKCTDETSFNVNGSWIDEMNDSAGSNRVNAMLMLLPEWNLDLSLAFERHVFRMMSQYQVMRA